MRRLLLAAALAFSPLAAQTAEAGEGDNIEARAGEFRIIHLWTLDPGAFMKAWASPTPPHLSTSTKTRRNQPIQQFILYANCWTDAAGNCHLAAHVEITAPDGKPYGKPIDFDAFPPAHPAPPGTIGMAPNSIGLTIENGEQLGIYNYGDSLLNP